MNIHLNNWLDEQEGLAKNTTNKNILRELNGQGYATKAPIFCTNCEEQVDKVDDIDGICEYCANY